RALMGGFMPAHEGADAGDEFAHAEWLCNIVIRADLEPNHAIGLFAASRQHEYWNSRILVVLPHLTTDFQSIHSRQHEVEHQQVRLVTANLCQNETPVGDRAYTETLCF